MTLFISRKRGNDLNVVQVDMSFNEASLSKIQSHYNNHAEGLQLL